ncbi:hypothetical protein ElyMa_002202200 [Elysia marginata]|uniref:Uncharacterized protein n=1 Tax=Elysia marginata TaxID=1093978 RepID=A0AAV4FSR6_9GAST|nr:hypothetical protein ElyMa_002202200 [Elysia marginata]
MWVKPLPSKKFYAEKCRNLDELKQCNDKFQRLCKPGKKRNAIKLKAKMAMKGVEYLCNPNEKINIKINIKINSIGPTLDASAAEQDT